MRWWRSWHRLEIQLILAGPYCIMLLITSLALCMCSSSPSSQRKTRNHLLYQFIPWDICWAAFLCAPQGRFRDFSVVYLQYSKPSLITAFITYHLVTSPYSSKARNNAWSLGPLLPLSTPYPRECPRDRRKLFLKAMGKGGVRGQIEEKVSLQSCPWFLWESSSLSHGPKADWIPAGWDTGFPGQLLSSHMVFVPLILEQIKQSSLINGFPPCLSEQILKHSLHLSLLPSHSSVFQPEAFALRPRLWPTYHRYPSSTGLIICVICLIQIAQEKFQDSLTDTSWLLTSCLGPWAKMYWCIYYDCLVILVLEAPSNERTQRKINRTKGAKMNLSEPISSFM